MRSYPGVVSNAPRPDAPLADERGFLLVMVMVVMLVVSTLVASTLINSFLERSLAKNQNYASVALQAAEGGLAAGVTWVRENGSLLPSASPWSDNANWPKTLTRTLPSGGTYAVTMRYKREWTSYNDDNNDGSIGAGDDCLDPGESSGYQDNDGSPDTVCPGDIVLYNSCSGADNCFDFPDALYHGAGEGYPIIEIASTGYFGTDAAAASSFREIVLDIARNKIDIQVEGAITARGNITVSGSGYVDGHNFNDAGTAASSTCADLQAITVDPDAAVPDTANGCDDSGDIPGGNPKGTYTTACPPEKYDPSAPGKRPLATDPWGALGITQADFDDIFTQTSTATALTGTAAEPTYMYMTADLHVTGGSGYGILVVHNPNFAPDTWETNCPTGVTGAGYCTAANGPATFFMNGNVKYTGVIIADQIMRVNGTAETVGAVIAIGGANVDGDVTGNWTAKYSCDAVANALGGFGYGTKISWHRVR